MDYFVAMGSKEGNEKFCILNIDQISCMKKVDDENVTICMKNGDRININNNNELINFVWRNITARNFKDEELGIQDILFRAKWSAIIWLGIIIGTGTAALKYLVSLIPM